jgi:hypothetical protein
MTARLTVACALAVGALLAGCTVTTDGRPVGGPSWGSEPEFPTARPTVRPPTTAPPQTVTPRPSPTLTAAPPPGAQMLPPQNGYVFIQTRSGKTRCQLSTTKVGCESEFTNSPVLNGEPANGVQVNANGQLSWLAGNLGDIPTVTLDYRTYSAVGWTIQAGSDGTRFTNDRTGHGMFVSVDKVEVF